MLVLVKKQKKLYQPYFKGMKETMRLIKSKETDERELAQKFDEVQKNYSAFLVNRVDEWEKDSIAAVKRILTWRRDLS